MSIETRDRICISLVPASYKLNYRNGELFIGLDGLWVAITVGDCPKRFYMGLSEAIRFIKGCI